MNSRIKKPKRTAKKTTPKSTSTVVKKAVEKTTSKNGAASRKRGKSLTLKDRQFMIEKVAYFRAEARGFNGNNPMDDWVVSEALVDSLFVKNEQS